VVLGIHTKSFGAKLCLHENQIKFIPVFLKKRLLVLEWPTRNADLIKNSDFKRLRYDAYLKKCKEDVSDCTIFLYVHSQLHVHFKIINFYLQ